MKPETKKAEEKMQKALAALNSNFNTIRAGRANP
ncbi:MAG TPA: ribosome recycling factor, partial [Candidatus Faecivivens stercoravium]|nr:ribosome recycling factor [Candidatus Faecivivens stercoravium]